MVIMVRIESMGNKSMKRVKFQKLSNERWEGAEKSEIKNPTKRSISVK